MMPNSSTRAAKMATSGPLPPRFCLAGVLCTVTCEMPVPGIDAVFMVFPLAILVTRYPLTPALVLMPDLLNVARNGPSLMLFLNLKPIENPSATPKVLQESCYKCQL